MSKQEFEGFTIPEETLLPREFKQLLPHLKTLGEVKVLLVILSEYLLPGLDARPLTHNEIQESAGLARGTVNAALLGLRERLGCIKRIGAPGGGYLYEPTLRKSLESLIIRPPMHDTLHESCHDQAFTDVDACMHELVKILNEQCGVSLRIARDIVKRHDHEVIRQHIEYAMCAAEKGIIRRTMAAYVVASIRDNWGPPAGWSEKKKTRWFTDEEAEIYFGHPEDFDE